MSNLIIGIIIGLIAYPLIRYFILRMCKRTQGRWDAARGRD